MKIRKLLLGLTAAVAGALIATSCQEASDIAQESQVAVEQDLSDIIKELKIENLLRDSLALAPEVEVIVSYLEVPVKAALPLHYHPGEEFVYMLEGAGDLTLGGEVITLREGDLYKIPMRAEHSFKTNDEQGRAVVFRVHEKGQPDRFLVEQ